MRTFTRLLGLLAGVVLGVLVLLPAGSLASGSAPNWVGVGQTVIAATTPTGQISGKPKVFTQFSANGHGPATLKVPMSTSGFRNLSGLGTPPVKGGYAVWNLHLSGPTNARAVANFPKNKLPLTVSAAYELNGKKMSAKSIVGKSGKLKVSYVITNVTEKDTKVSFKNSLGEQETTTVKAPVPVAAIVKVTIPADFTNVKTPSAGYSATGNGTSTAEWTLFLFDPLGGVKQSVSYEAHVTDVNVPSATLEAQVLPSKSVKPLPTIPEPGAPPVPTVTLGGHLASLQAAFQGKLRELSAQAAATLKKLAQFTLPATRRVSGNAAELAHFSLPAASEADGRLAAKAESNATALSEDAAQAAQNASRMAELQATLGEDAAQATQNASRVASLQAGLGEDAAQATKEASAVAEVHARLAEDAADAAEHAKRVHEVRVKVEALPFLVKRTTAVTDLRRTLGKLERELTTHAARLATRAVDTKRLEDEIRIHAVRLSVRAAHAKALEGDVSSHAAGLESKAAEAKTLEADLKTHAARLEARATRTKELQAAALEASTNLRQHVDERASMLSSEASEIAATLANAKLKPRERKHRATKPSKSTQPKAIQLKQVGGGAKVDAAVGKLDSAITGVGNEIDKRYAYLTALDKRAAETQLPAGNAVGATYQIAGYLYSIEGANNSAHEIHLATFIGGFALTLGLAFGIGFYRIRRGLPSSLAPPKSKPSPAKP